MKIYIITKGEYSDYHICAVATDPEKADALAKFYSDKYDPAEVEEYDTEEVHDLTKGGKVFRVRFSPAGDVTGIWDISPEWWHGNEPWEYKTKPGFVCVNVQADTKEDAVKIGAERRAKYLAEKEGL